MGGSGDVGDTQRTATHEEVPPTGRQTRQGAVSTRSLCRMRCMGAEPEKDNNNMWVSESKRIHMPQKDTEGEFWFVHSVNLKYSSPVDVLRYEDKY